MSDTWLTRLGKFEAGRLDAVRKYPLPENPNPPCDAALAVLTHLPDSYFSTPPPDNGVRLVVQGRDGIKVSYDMPDEMCGKLYDALADDPGVAFAAVRYEGAPRV